jgi:hypothetical protein
MGNNFRVGQKVVCIRRRQGDLFDGEHDPVLGQVYTIRSLSYWEGMLGLHLEEIINPIVMTRCGILERCFYAYRFRPVVERKTSIEIFTAMLNPSKTREHVE